MKSITLAIPESAAEKLGERARQMKVVRRRVVTIESQAGGPMIAAERHVDALKALAA